MGHMFARHKGFASHATNCAPVLRTKRDEIRTCLDAASNALGCRAEMQLGFCFDDLHSLTEPLRVSLEAINPTLGRGNGNERIGTRNDS